MRIDRIEVDGFRSVDHATADLTTVHTTAVSGHNGAGKSSVFAYAPAWALWAVTPDGVTADGIINRESTAATVTVDFTVDDVPYRVTRRRPRAGRTIARIERCDTGEVLAAGNPSDVDKVIVETVGFDWTVARNTVFAFQGDSAAFMAATPADRRDLLSTLAGLERFARWHRDAGARATAARRDLDRSAGAIAALTAVLENELEHLGEAAETAETAAAAKTAAADAARRVVEATSEHAGLQTEVNTVLAGINTRRAALAAEERERRDRLDAVSERLAATAAALAAVETRLAAAPVTGEPVETCRQALNDARTVAAAADDALGQTRGVVADAQQHLDRAVETRAVAVAEQTAAAARAAALTGEHAACPTCRQDLADPHAVAAAATAEHAAAAAATVEAEANVEQARLYVSTIRTAVAEAERDTVTARSAVETAARRLVDAEAAETAVMLRVETDRVDRAEQQRLTTEAAVLRHELGDARNGLVNPDDDRELAELTAQHRQLVEAARALPDIARLQAQAAVARTVETDTAQAAATAAARVETDAEQRRNLETEEEASAVAADDLDVWKTVAAAFHRDGIPAMVLTATVETLEAAANQTLASWGGDHTLRMVTARHNANGSTRETLDVEVVDADGNSRPYASYSGGERFRFDLAIRLALADLFATTTGGAAPPATLIFDEGFGTLDADGIAGALDALTGAADRFDRVILVSHIPEVTGAVETQFRLTRGADGGTVVETI